VTWKQVAALLFVALVAWVASVLTQGQDVVRGREAVAEAFAQRRSGVLVELEAPVLKVLPDDREGSRHQRFLLDLGRGLTVLVSHNIDLAPRVPVEAGDAVEVHGQYEYNEKGGVIHWTHHDPGGRREGGEIRHGGKVYR
jgi:hypothetical protein